ncbi:uncharacterized protein LOC120258656 [Dioscorea cayenensis subsp. rotundata]|uniref:Uncharacterized protein LOC120258656 n=1 Tax=Dioscorea cayennensis subsp. rotundata TaxID=55577 RepID=A0AB40B434_DIOCR|nr:uncharacterized protein LOC120258656 [Dioscorea cayenensis subsp. rotundata]
MAFSYAGKQVVLAQIHNWLKTNKEDAQFLKDLLTNKRKLEEVDTVALIGNCSTILDKKLLMKLRDPGSFVIPCLLGEGMEKHALANSRASINMIPYTIYMKLGLGELSPTKMTLRLGDISVRSPWGIVEDVLVTVEKLVFPWIL